MNESEPPSPIPPDRLADLEEICRRLITGGVRDPELLERIRRRSEAAPKEIREKYAELPSLST
jgi:hypothetical protein